MSKKILQVLEDKTKVKKSFPTGRYDEIDFAPTERNPKGITLDEAVSTRPIRGTIFTPNGGILFTGEFDQFEQATELQGMSNKGNKR